MKQVRTKDIKIGEHNLRVVLDTHGKGGIYCPTLRVALKGPNGSPAGYGPKCWPSWVKTTPGSGRTAIGCTLPHLTWARAYKLRRFGGLRLYKAIERRYAAIAAA